MSFLDRILGDIRIDSPNAINDLKNEIHNKRFSGGICQYTVNHYDNNGLDLRSSNLSKNYDNGEKKRVEYKDINISYFYKIKDTGLTNVGLENNESIGRLYYLPDNGFNSNLKFITTNDFSLLNNELRKLLLRYNDNIISAKSEDYASNNIIGAKSFNGKRIPNGNIIGEEYYSGNIPKPYVKHDNLMDYSIDFRDKIFDKTNDVDKNIYNSIQYKYKNINATTNDETIGINYSLTNNYDDISTTHLDRFYSKSYNYFLPLNIGKKKIENYTELRKYNSNFSYFKSDNPGQSISKDLVLMNYGEIVDLPNIQEVQKSLNNIIKVDFDLLNVRSEENRILMFDENQNLFGYFYGNAYSIDGTDKIEEYSINQKENIPETVKITNSNSGTLIGGKSGRKFYVAYSEAENEENNVPDIQSDETKNSISQLKYDIYSPLIEKTNELFKQMKINSMINRFHLSKINGNDKSVINGDDELLTSYTKYGISRGRNLITKDAENSLEKKDGYENPYCRVWTMAHQYSKLNRRIRPFYDDDKPMGIEDTVVDSNLRPNRVGRLNKYSVLENDGFVKMTPRNDGGIYEDDNTDLRKYMFSIENLAWKDVDMETAGISKEQIGPNGGRIMWFPPYNLRFNENVNVEWNQNKFIGRGEQIYTYTNTERDGNLDFTLLIDHPSIINKLNSSNNNSDERERDLLRFFAGCNNLDFENDNKKPEESQKPIDIEPLITPKMDKQSKDIAYVLFFPNNYSGIDHTGNELISNASNEYSLRNYECDANTGHTFTLVDNSYKNQIYNDNYTNINRNKYSMNNNLSLISDEVKSILFNKGELSNESLDVYYIFDNNNGIDNLASFVLSGGAFGDKFKNVEITSIDLYGFASSHGYETYNRELGLRRANTMKKIIETCNLGASVNNKFNKNIKTDIISVNSPRDINEKDAKIARSAIAVFHVQWDIDTECESENENINKINVLLKEDISKAKKEDKVVATTFEENNDSLYRYDNEYLYFKKIKEDDFAYNTILNKVKYFLPAYHSITPEGFNARLSFLHQCTRQGPTVELSSGRVNSNSNDYLRFAGNLSFGRPPYCILRIGDFFNTKICITSINITYENDGGVQWDLNPEGIGVQPMYANVTISFKFIGGQDISGPIERLQNAVTYNYYANTSVYDNKSDYRNGTGEISKPYDVMLTK